MQGYWFIRWFNRWWFWDDRDSPSAALVRSWRRVVFAVAILMPFFAIVGTFVLIALNRPTLSPVYPLASLISGFLSLLLLWLYGSFVANWPFWIFGKIITRHLRNKWPPAQGDLQGWIGGFIGLSLPYAFGYWAMPFELTSGAYDAGQGIGLYLGVIAPILGGIIGLAGWLLGFAISELWGKADSGSK